MQDDRHTPEEPGPEQDEFIKQRVQWEKTGNPRWVWRVVATILLHEDMALPPWVENYLIDVAKGIVTVEGDIGRELHGILKFPQKFRRVDSYLKDEKFGIEFMREILKGATAFKARENAAATLKIKDDDPQLTRRLKNFFQLETLPAGNERWKWKGIIAFHLMNNPTYREDYPDLPTEFNFR